MEIKEILTLSPYDNFMYALKAETTKPQYPNRLDRFLSFIGLQGSIQEKCNALFEISKNKEVLYSHLIRFINSQKTRIQNKIFVSDRNFSKMIFYRVSQLVQAMHRIIAHLLYIHNVLSMTMNKTNTGKPINPSVLGQFWMTNCVTSNTSQILYWQ